MSSLATSKKRNHYQMQAIDENQRDLETWKLHFSDEILAAVDFLADCAQRYDAQAPDSPPARYSAWAWETQFTPEQVISMSISSLNIESKNIEGEILKVKY